MARWLSRRSPRRIFLHIGAPSTGTTYLQRLMIANKDALAEAGCLFPGDRWEDVVRAVRDVMGTTAHDARLRAETEGAWERLSREMLAYDGGSVVLSMEFLCFADPEVAARIVDSLADAEVHVVLTVRDTASVIRSQWQTSCRNGSKVPLQRLLWALRSTLDSEEPPDNRPVRMITRALGIPRMLETWIPLVGPKRVHVITVPTASADPDLLWKRFAKVVGVNPSVGAEKSVHANPSLGLPSSELLRMVNIALGDVHRIEYRRVVKATLARDVLGGLADAEPKVTLNRPGRNLSARWNQRVRDAIAESGVRVVGSLDDLPTERAPETAPTELAKPSDEQLVAAAAHASAQMATVVADLRDKVAAARAAVAAGTPLAALADDDDGYELDEQDEQDERSGRPPAADQDEQDEQDGPDGQDGQVTDDGQPASPLRQLEARSETVQAAVWELTGLVRAAVDLQRELATLRTGPAPDPAAPPPG